MRYCSHSTPPPSLLTGVKMVPLPAFLHLKRGQLFLIISTGDFGVSRGATVLQLATGFRGKCFSHAHIAYLHELSECMSDICIWICLNTLNIGIALCKCACVWVLGSSKLPIITGLRQQHSKFVLSSPWTHHFVVLYQNEPAYHHDWLPVRSLGVSSLLVIQCLRVEGCGPHSTCLDRPMQRSP